MTMEKVTRFSLSDLVKATILCKNCGTKMTFPLEYIGKLTGLSCSRCANNLGTQTSDFYLGTFARELCHLNEDKGIDIEFELTKPRKE